MDDDLAAFLGPTDRLRKRGGRLGPHQLCLTYYLAEEQPPPPLRDLLQGGIDRRRQRAGRPRPGWEPRHAGWPARDGRVPGRRVTTRGTRGNRMDNRPAATDRIPAFPASDAETARLARPVSTLPTGRLRLRARRISPGAQGTGRIRAGDRVSCRLSRPGDWTWTRANGFPGRSDRRTLRLTATASSRSRAALDTHLRPAEGGASPGCVYPLKPAARMCYSAPVTTTNHAPTIHYPLSTIHYETRVSHFSDRCLISQIGMEQNET